MTDNTGRNGTNKSEQNGLFESFSTEEIDLVEKIWEKSPLAEPNHSVVTEEETERALQNVHKRLSDFDNTKPDMQTGWAPGWRWIAAAAAVLLILGAGWFLTPQTVTAPYGEIATVNLPDGSTVDLNSGSEIRYNRLFTLTNRTVSLKGEAFFTVEIADHPFVVNTNNSAVKVTGTAFNVRSWSEEPDIETEVAVSEGAVKFYPLGDPDSSVTVSPGELSRLTIQLEKPTAPESVAIDRFMGWRENKLIFNDKTLVVIFRELERRFDTEIEIEAGEAARETLTTYYANPKDIETILEDICRVKGLRYAKTATGYRVY